MSSSDTTTSFKAGGITANGSGYAEETIDHDRNGNLIYDGVQKYTFDAWNRLRAIAHAYRSGGTVVQKRRYYGLSDNYCRRCD